MLDVLIYKGSNDMVAFFADPEVVPLLPIDHAPWTYFRKASWDPLRAAPVFPPDLTAAISDIKDHGYHIASGKDAVWPEVPRAERDHA